MDRSADVEVELAHESVRRELLVYRCDEVHEGLLHLRRRVDARTGSDIERARGSAHAEIVERSDRLGG
jgi:hypothetical protein